MSRRRRATHREIAPDPRFGSMELAKFINRLMMGGKKSVARRAMYDALGRLESETNRPGLEVFQQAIRNATPTLEVKPRRVGGATYQVPVEVRLERRSALASPVDHPGGAGTLRQAGSGTTVPGVTRGIEGSGHRDPTPGRTAQNGGCQPRIRPLPLVRYHSRVSREQSIRGDGRQALMSQAISQ